MAINNFRAFDDRGAHFEDVAVLNRQPSEIAEACGIEFQYWDGDFDLLDFAPIVLSNDERVVLARYRNAPYPGTRVKVPVDRIHDGIKILNALISEMSGAIPTVGATWIRPNMGKIAAEDFKTGVAYLDPD